MDDEKTLITPNLNAVWGRVTAREEFAPPVTRQDYGSFCIIPDPCQKSCAVRFAPEL